MKLAFTKFIWMKSIFILNFQLNNSELGTAQPQLVLFKDTFWYKHSNPPNIEACNG